MSRGSRGSQLRVRAGLRTAAVLTVGLVGAAGLAGCGADDGATADDPTGESSSAAPTELPTDSPTESAPPTPTDAAPPTDGATEQGFDLPACDAVWVVGQQLPGGYEGCLAADGSPVDGAGQYCEFGKPIFTYGKRFYAVSGGPVVQTERTLANDARFKKAQRSCAG